MDDSPIAALITRVRGHLATMSYQAEERVDFSMLVDALVKTRAAIEPFVEFVTGSVSDALPDDLVITAGSRMARRQLTVADCRRAHAAFHGEK